MARDSGSNAVLVVVGLLGAYVVYRMFSARSVSAAQQQAAQNNSLASTLAKLFGKGTSSGKGSGSASSAGKGSSPAGAAGSRGAGSKAAAELAALLGAGPLTIGQSLASGIGVTSGNQGVLAGIFNLQNGYAYGDASQTLSDFYQPLYDSTEASILPTDAPQLPFENSNQTLDLSNVWFDLPGGSGSDLSTLDLGGGPGGYDAGVNTFDSAGVDEMSFV